MFILLPIAWWAAVYGVAKSWTRLSDFTFTVHFYALEKEMATHSRVLAWRIPGTGEPGGLPSMGSDRVGHDWNDLAAAASFQLIWLTLQKGGEFEVHRKNIWTVLVSSHFMPLFVKGMIFIKIEKRGFLSIAVAVEEEPNATALLMDLTPFILLLETFASSALMVYNLGCLLILYVEMIYFILIFWMSPYPHYGVGIGVIEWNGN